MIHDRSENRFAAGLQTAVSVIFNPLFLPLYGLLIIFTAPTLFWYLQLKLKEILFFIFLINNILVPVTLMPLFRYKPLFRSVTDDTKRVRLSWLAVVTSLYLITSFILMRLQIPVFLKAYSVSVTALSIVLLIISTVWNISVYSAGAGALTALVVILSLKMYSGLPFYLVSVVILSGLILTSRLKSGLHNPVQVYTGFIAGFIIIATGMLLFQ